MTYIYAILLYATVRAPKPTVKYAGIKYMTKMAVLNSAPQAECVIQLCYTVHLNQLLPNVFSITKCAFAANNTIYSLTLGR